MLSALAIAALLTCKAHAGNPPKPANVSAPTQETEEYKWAKDYIEVLSLVLESTHESPPETGPAGDIVTAKHRLLDQITGGKKAMIDLRQAKQILAPYKASKKKELPDLASTNIAFLDAMLENFTELNKISLPVYNGEMPKDYADKMSDISAQTDKDWNQFLKIAAISSLGTRLTPHDPNGTYDTLGFNKAKRNELLRQMEDRFGAKVKNSRTADRRSCAELAPAMFYSGLSKPELKFH